VACIEGLCITFKVELTGFGGKKCSLCKALRKLLYREAKHNIYSKQGRDESPYSLMLNSMRTGEERSVVA